MVVKGLNVFTITMSFIRVLQAETDINIGCMHVDLSCRYIGMYWVRGWYVLYISLNTTGMRIGYCVQFVIVVIGCLTDTLYLKQLIFSAQ